jgi:molybdopterin-dependent oxidoreductase alpha subunit
MTKSSKPEKAGGLPSVTSTFTQVLRSKRVKTNLKNLVKVNKSGGFDCPGCAWGDSNEGMVHFCENGAKAIAWECTDQKVDAEFFEKHSVSSLRKQSSYWLEYQGRLCEPVRYNKTTDKYEKISWDAAFELIASHLNALDSANEVEFYTSGRASNEASYLYQLFGRMFGTNNFPDCSNMCHEASGIALNAAIGVGKGTVVLDDFYAANAIFVFGQNPGSNHPRMMNTLRKAAKQGCKIVSVNNLKEVSLQRFGSPQNPFELLTPKSTTISHQYLSPKLGSDIALIRAMAKIIFEQYPDAIDTQFIEQHCADFDAYKDIVNNTPWDKLLAQTGLLKEAIIDATKVFAYSKNVISTWAMGLTQHKHSVDTIRELCNLHLLTGQIGKKGAGLSPVRGHSNVQGNRTMGINENPSSDFLHTLGAYFTHKMPTESGHNVHGALKALYEGRSKVLICLGGNLAAAAPDTAYTQHAMCNAKLNVQISTKLNKSHLMAKHDALILPCLGRTEVDMQEGFAQQVTVEDTFSMVHASAGSAPPISDMCRSETYIVANIAHHTLRHKQPHTNNDIDWLALCKDYNKIRDLIANTIEGFEQFNQRLQTPNGFYLQNAAAVKQWRTHNGKANFGFAALPSSLYGESVDTEIAKQSQPIYTLQSMRSHDQYNTTIYGADDRYRGIKDARNVVFINRKDAEKSGFTENQLVDIEAIWDDSVTRELKHFVLVFYDIPRGNVAAYYPEANPLIPIDSVGDQSFTPTSKSVPVILKPALRGSH